MLCDYITQNFVVDVNPPVVSPVPQIDGLLEGIELQDLQ